MFLNTYNNRFIIKLLLSPKSAMLHVQANHADVCPRGTGHSLRYETIKWILSIEWYVHTIKKTHLLELVSAAQNIVHYSSTAIIKSDTH